MGASGKRVPGRKGLKVKGEFLGLEAVSAKVCGWAAGKAVLAVIRVHSRMCVEGNKQEGGLARPYPRLEQQAEEPDLGDKMSGVDI